MTSNSYKLNTGAEENRPIDAQTTFDPALRGYSICVGYLRLVLKSNFLAGNQILGTKKTAFNFSLAASSSLGFDPKFLVHLESSVEKLNSFSGSHYLFVKERFERTYIKGSRLPCQPVFPIERSF